MTFNHCLARLHEELVATGAVNLKGIKSRAVRLTDYRIADGDPAYAFVHVSLLIREGRPLEVQQEAARRVMNVLKETFGSDSRADTCPSRWTSRKWVRELLRLCTTSRKKEKRHE